MPLRTTSTGASPAMMGPYLVDGTVPPPHSRGTRRGRDEPEPQCNKFGKTSDNRVVPPPQARNMRPKWAARHRRNSSVVQNGGSIDYVARTKMQSPKPQPQGRGMRSQDHSTTASRRASTSGAGMLGHYEVQIPATPLVNAGVSLRSGTTFSATGPVYATAVMLGSYRVERVEVPGSVETQVTAKPMLPVPKIVSGTSQDERQEEHTHGPVPRPTVPDLVPADNPLTSAPKLPTDDGPFPPNPHAYRSADDCCVRITHNFHCNHPAYITQKTCNGGSHGFHAIEMWEALCRKCRNNVVEHSQGHAYDPECSACKARTTDRLMPFRPRTWGDRPLLPLTERPASPEMGFRSPVYRPTPPREEDPLDTAD